MSFKIRGTQRLVLIQKYKNEGWPEDKIKKHFDYLNNYFEIKAIKLRKKNMSEIDIHQKFMEEFAKLIS